MLLKSHNAREFLQANMASCTSNHMLGSCWNDSLAPSMYLISVAMLRWYAFALADRTLCVSLRCLKLLDVDVPVSYITSLFWKHLLCGHAKNFSVLTFSRVFLNLTPVISKTDCEPFFERITSGSCNSGYLR